MFFNNVWYFVWCAVIYDFQCLKVCTCNKQNTVGIHNLINCAMLQIMYNLKKYMYELGNVFLMNDCDLTDTTRYIRPRRNLSSVPDI